jgi:hypothetical protein
MAQRALCVSSSARAELSGDCGAWCRRTADTARARSTEGGKAAIHPVRPFFDRSASYSGHRLSIARMAAKAENTPAAVEAGITVASRQLPFTLFTRYGLHRQKWGGMRPSWQASCASGITGSLVVCPPVCDGVTSPVTDERYRPGRDLLDRRRVQSWELSRPLS